MWSSRQLQSRLTRKVCLAKEKNTSTLTYTHSISTELLPVSEAMHLHKRLYYQIHNLEDHPSILPQARDLLISLFAEVLEKTQEDSSGTILAIKQYDTETLSQFLRKKDHKITVQWEQYLERRKAGKPREMFMDRSHAIWWLKQSAPAKYVDGAWLGHIHKVSTPFALRSVTKTAWQILSEELGDGDLAKNHVHIYRQLMSELGYELDEGYSRTFVDDEQLDTPQVWKAAVAQLLISLFPHEFLPEILGFNMHFEMLTWDTLRAIKELKELGLNNYYFLLHVSIDNADSGHTAMAMQSVVEYMKHIEATEGTSMASQMWRRI